MHGITLTCDPLIGLKLMSTVSTLRQLGTEPVCWVYQEILPLPSRFIRALAWTQTSRPTDGGEDTVHEALRILANFQLPMEATDQKLKSCRAQGSEVRRHAIHGVL